VAQFADVSNFGSSVEEFIAKREILKSHCKAVGRDEDEIRKTVSSEVFIRETEAEIIAEGSRSLWGEPFEQWRDKALVGTPEQVSEKIERYIAAGCTGFIPWCPDYPSTQTIDLFAEKVMPNFR
jgi:alkanesulfonate monooxygenase SsuD/methylene tetrahydromethanopterin reductase-like flavin-dependent oxidoreductase (luciferase family)